MKIFLCIVACILATVNPAFAAVYNWSQTCNRFNFNPENVRDPTIIWDTSASATGTCAGYDGTPYAFSPCNNAPNGTWVTVPLAQFGINNAKMIFINGRFDMTGSGRLDVWFRAPGSTWNLSPAAQAYWASPLPGTWVPVANNAIQYKLLKTGNPTFWQLNAIINGYCWQE